MIQDIITLILYIFNKFLDFLFGAYITEGVSLGMIIVVVTVFGIILKYLLAVPSTRGGNEKGSSSSSSSNS